MNGNGFWDNQDRARKIVNEVKALKAITEGLRTAIKGGGNG